MYDWMTAPFGAYWFDFISMLLLSIGIISIIIYCFKNYNIGFPLIRPLILFIFAFWLTGMLFGQFFSAINYFNPNSFENTSGVEGNWDFTYYSFSIITALGPTDIAPFSYLAKWTSLIEAGVSLFFLSVLISLLLNTTTTKSHD